VSHLDYLLDASLGIGAFNRFQIEQKTENSFQSFLRFESQIFKSVKESWSFLGCYVHSNMMIFSNEFYSIFDKDIPSLRKLRELIFDLSTLILS
jgi:hypothetical protein